MRPRPGTAGLASSAIALVLAAVPGCFVFHDDYPDRSCRSDVDCFRAQGEVCNPQSRRCETAVDAPPPARDAGPGAGMDAADAASDAGSADGGAGDAGWARVAPGATRRLAASAPTGPPGSLPR